MDGKIEIEESARIVKRSARSVYRMIAKVREKGPEGILHGNRNKANPRCLPNKLRKELVSLALGKYHDINDTHLREISTCYVRNSGHSKCLDMTYLCLPRILSNIDWVMKCCRL